MPISFDGVIPILRIFDTARTKQFSLEYLGCTASADDSERPSPVYAQVRRDGLVLHLSEHHGDACPGSTVYVDMKGIRELRRDAKGYQYLNAGIEETPWGAWCMELLDPFGNRLRLCEVIDDGEQ